MSPWVAVVAYVFLNLSAVPAILKMRRNQSSKDVSILWQSMILMGVLVVLIYALEVGEPVWIFGGFLNAIAISAVISTAVKYR